MDGSVATLLNQYSEKYQIPTWITSSIVQVESNFNPQATGDNNTSFGLLQLHWGGQGTINGVNVPKEELENPVRNLEIGMPPIAKAYQTGTSQGLSGYPLLEYTAGHSGHPSYNGTFTTGYKGALQLAFTDGDELAGMATIDWKKWVDGDTSGLNQEFLARLANFAQAKKKKLTITSGYRTVEEQEQLYEKYQKGIGNLAAKPGDSRHNYGLAADVAGWAINEPDSEYRKFGLYKAVTSEAWHIEPTETTGKSASELKGITLGTKAIQTEMKGKNLNYTPEDVGVFSLFDLIDQTAKGSDFDATNPVKSIVDNTKAFGLRAGIFFIGLILFLFGLIQIVGAEKIATAVAPEAAAVV